MASTLDSLIGVIPVVLVAGVAMKLTEKVFPTQQVAPKKISTRSTGRSRRPNSVGFGNFRNIGF